MLLINGSSTIYLEWFKEEAYIEENQSLILGKKYKTLIIKEKYNFIKSLSTLCWKCDLIVNKATPLSTQISSPKTLTNGSKHYADMTQ